MKRIDFDKGYIIVDAIDPSSEFSDSLTEADREFLATLNSPSRRAQWSTWRRIVRAELGPDAVLRYNGLGAPVLVAPAKGMAYISVSHTATHAAVMFSRSRCGVDIETPDRDFTKVASRYIAHEERPLASLLGELFEPIIWCAKEALYKFGGHSGVDFTQDMIIVAADPVGQTLSAELFSVATPPVRYIASSAEIMCYVTE